MVIFRKKYIYNIEKFFLEQKKITFLIWPRRVGKTFLMQMFYKKFEKESVWVSFEEFLWISFKSVEEFLYFLEKQTGKKDFKYIFLDEIQLVPGISWILKKLYDDPNYDYFILCSGSWSFNVFSVVEDSLVWRVKIIDVYPLDFAEFIKFKADLDLEDFYYKFSLPILNKYWFYLEEFLRFGWYPEVVLTSTEEEKVEILNDIVKLWLDKDIKLLLKTQDILDFSKFFRWIARRITSIFKVWTLSSELGIKYHKIKNFFEILKKSYILLTLPVLTEKYSYELKAGEKIYFVDNGLLNSVLWDFSLEGRWDLIENFVISEILKNKKSIYRYYFWKKVNQSEIDMIVKNVLDNVYYPIEVKSKSTSVIPKVFYSFSKIYNSKLAIVFNRDQLTTKKTQSLKIKVVPYFLASIYEKVLKD